METECFTMGINDQHGVADVEVAQTPNPRRASAWAIQVSSNHCAAPFAWMRTCVVPADIVPGMLPRRFHRAIWSNSHRLDRGIDTDGRNGQAYERSSSPTCRAQTDRQPAPRQPQTHQPNHYSP